MSGSRPSAGKGYLMVLKTEPCLTSQGNVCIYHVVCIQSSAQARHKKKRTNRIFVVAKGQCVVTESPKQFPCGLQASLSLPVNWLCSSSHIEEPQTAYLSGERATKPQTSWQTCHMLYRNRSSREWSKKLAQTCPLIWL